MILCLFLTVCFWKFTQKNSEYSIGMQEGKSVVLSMNLESRWECVCAKHFFKICFILFIFNVIQSHSPVFWIYVSKQFIDSEQWSIQKRSIFRWILWCYCTRNEVAFAKTYRQTCTHSQTQSMGFSCLNQMKGRLCRILRINSLCSTNIRQYIECEKSSPLSNHSTINHRYTHTIIRLPSYKNI